MDKASLITSIDEAKRFMVDCFKAVGTSEENADLVAENLLQADYRGHYSHGMNRLSWYVNDILNKKLEPNATPQIEKETVATALVNGNNGLGAVIGRYCMQLAIKKAKEVGIGMVSVHGSNHFGIAGMYSLQAIEKDCIGMSFTNTSPVMVPTRAKNRCLGTLPISMSAPAVNNDSFVLDMATTTVAVGKIELCKRIGNPLPAGWALNNEGNIETDPDIALQAKRLLPLGGDESTGGYKGFGLAMMIEILCGILSGANYGPNIPLWGIGEGIANLGQAFIAIDPHVFAPGFEDRLGDLISTIRHMEPKNHDKPVLIPGDPEKNHMEKIKGQGGFYYVKDQHDSNLILAKKLRVMPLKSVIRKK